MLKKIGYYYPFTIPGTVSFGLLMYLIGTGYTRKNPYALFLSVTGLLILAVLVVLTRIQAYRLGKEQLIWDAGTALYAGRTGAAERFYSGGFRTWFFFRVHVRIRGKLILGKGLLYRVVREASWTGDGALEVPLSFPCTGTFAGEGVYSIKDVFGLVRAGAGTPAARSIPVRPSLLSDESPVYIQISGGEDDRQPRKSSDEEKYYQREYIPGDRLRDINWKATSRIGEMFTRIAPVTEEQTKLVLVDFRHFSADRRFGRDHAAHMEYLKRWCVSFLWKIKSKQPEFQFVVYTGFGALAVESLGDVHRLSIGLSGIFYEDDPKLRKDVTGIGEIYIFTTPFDSGLRYALQVYSGKKTTIFTTAFPPKGGAGEEETVTLSLLNNGGMVHIPGPWVLKHASGSAAGNRPPGGGTPALRRYVQGSLL